MSVCRRRSRGAENNSFAVDGVRLEVLDLGQLNVNGHGADFIGNTFAAIRRRRHACQRRSRHRGHQTHPQPGVTGAIRFANRAGILRIVTVRSYGDHSDAGSGDEVGKSSWFPRSAHRAHSGTGTVIFELVPQLPR